MTTDANATPFGKLAEAFEAKSWVETREGAKVELFRVRRANGIIEAAQHPGEPPLLVLRAYEEDPPQSSGRASELLARVKRRLVYPKLTLRKATVLDRLGALLSFRAGAGSELDRALAIDHELSDDVALGALSDPEARAAALCLVSLGMTVRFEERAICAEIPASSVLAKPGSAALDPALDALVLLAVSVPRFDASAVTKRPQTGRFFWVAIVVIGLFGALALAPGMLTAKGVDVHPLPRPLSPLSAMLPGILTGLALFLVVLCGVRLGLKRRRAKTDSVLWLALCVVLCASSVGALDAANRLLDDAPVVTHEVRVISKEPALNGESGPIAERNLVVVSWQQGSDKLEIAPGFEIASAVRVGDTVRVSVHPGLFGWEWGASVAIGAPSK